MFNSQSPAGTRLNGLTGIAAILRFELNLDELVSSEDEGDIKSDDDTASEMQQSDNTTEEKKSAEQAAEVSVSGEEAADFMNSDGFDQDLENLLNTIGCGADDLVDDTDEPELTAV